MGLIKLVFMLVVIAAIGGAAFYFAPDALKEKALTYINGQNFIPAEVKKAVEDIYATPGYQREKLLAELDKNFSAITQAVENPSASKTEQTAALKTIERTKEIVQQLSEVKSDPTLISKITEIVTEKVLSAAGTNSPDACKGQGSDQ